jgi:hypothetical protein
MLIISVQGRKQRLAIREQGLEKLSSVGTSELAGCQRETPSSPKDDGVRVKGLRRSYWPFNMDMTGSGSCWSAFLRSRATSHISSLVRTCWKAGMPVSRMPFLIFQ